MKKRFVGTFICFLIAFLFCGATKIKAQDVIVVQKPIASDIIYGEPLFESRLNGGQANVEGNFFWEDGLTVLEVGEYSQNVLFTPSNKEYSPIRLTVDVKVNRKKVGIKFEEDIYKQYDGTPSIDLPNYVVEGIVDKSVYVKGTLVGELENVLIGTSKVILSGLELAGEKKDNYYLYLEGHSSCVYPNYVEKFGPIKNRVDFSKEIYVPLDSELYVDKVEDVNINKQYYDIKHVYDIYLKSGNERVDVNDNVYVKVKVEDKNFNYKRLKIYNYYKGNFEEVNYIYENGYIVYRANSLGKLVFAQKKLDFWWMYILLFVIIATGGLLVLVKKIKGREKINKYKSLKRGKDYGDY